MPLHADTSHRIAIKSAIEEVLGKEAWYEIKETTSLTPWRRNLLKVLRAIRLSVQATVAVRDEEWLNQIEDNIACAETRIRESKDIDDMLAVFSAALLRQTFLQLGFAVNYKGRPGVSLRSENWRLDDHRSVQYVQNESQIESMFWSEQQRRIGFEKQRELYEEHRQSKTKLRYSVWCREREA